MFNPKKHKVLITVVVIFIALATVLVYVPLFFR